MKLLRIFVSGFLLIAAANGFFVPLRHYEHGNTAVVFFASPNTNTVYSPDNPEGVTPNQIKTLRKEASKRLAWKTMATHNYVDTSDEHNADEETVNAFFAAICNDLSEQELVQIRGVSSNDKRKVFDTSQQLVEDVSAEMQRPVFVVDIKGHAVTLYCCSPDESKRTIILRSSYEPGRWELKMKAPRDHRGQIVKD